MKGLVDNTFSFGNIIVSPQAHTITLAGKQKRVEPRLITLLIYLAEHAPQVVTRQQITATIWPDVIVGEESITQAIFALRNALGDDAKNPKYIETIPKKGYRFLADVAVVPVEQQQALPAPSRKLQRNTIALSAGIILALSVLLWYTLKNDAPYEIANIVPVTKMSGAECCMTVNDNRKMVFINIIDEQSNFYVKDLSRGTQERITQDNWQKGLPVWLDSNTLIYSRCLNGQCQIVQQALQQSPQILYTTANYIGEIALTMIRSTLLLINEQSHNHSEFISLDLRSGKHEKLRDKYPGLPQHMIHPVFSPDSRQLYFVNLDSRPMLLMALDLGDGKVNLISDQFDEISSFSFDRQQQIITAGIYRSTMGIWLLDQAGEKPTLLLRSSGSEQFLFPMTDPVEQAIYYQSLQSNNDLGMVSGEGETADNFSELNATGTDSWGALSSDEKFLYFVSDRTGMQEVWRYDMDKQQNKPITQLKTSLLKLLRPSHSGQRFAAIYMDNLQTKLGVFAMHDGALLKSIDSLSHPLGWSRDDKYLYVEEVQNNVRTLMRYDSQTLTATEIEKNAGLFAQESADNQSILFMDLEKNTLVEKNIVSGKKQTLLSLDINLKDLWPGMLRLDSKHSSLLVIKQNSDTQQLWRYPFNAIDLTPSKLMDLPARTQVTFINPEGSKVLYSRQMPSTGDIMKLELK